MKKLQKSYCNVGFMDEGMPISCDLCGRFQNSKISTSLAQTSISKREFKRGPDLIEEKENNRKLSYRMEQRQTKIYLNHRLDQLEESADETLKAVELCRKKHGVFHCCVCPHR
jgi:hypothetical protein